MNRKRIVIAHPHGFCSGVARAVEAIGEALRRYPPPVYCYHEVVHNRQIVEHLARQGVRFVETLDGVPDGATLLFSAHGVAPAVRRDAQRKRLRVIDATCPFVARAHAKAQRLAARDCGILLIGHRGHEEVEGVAAEAPERTLIVENEADAMAVCPPNPDRLGVVTQTTLSVAFVQTVLARLQERFPHLAAPKRGDICYATQNRQQAVQALARAADTVLVLGSRNSSNSRRLAEIAHACGRPAFLISQRADLAEANLSATETLGLTSGASTPESFLEEILADVRAQGFVHTENLVVAHENVHSFPLPDFP